MIIDIFENREKTVWSLFKLADCLGRSLRENVQLFSLDSQNKRASFVTDSDHVINGKISKEDGCLVLEDIAVQSSDLFSDNESFNSFVSDKIKTFVSFIHESDYSEAGTSFDNIVNLWETRLQFNEVKNRLEEVSQAFSSTQDIITTPEFQNFLEISPQIISWLQSDKEKISSISEIKNAVKLSNSVSKAFDTPKISIEQLNEDGKIIFNDKVNKSIYEMICRQELVTKELRESKRNFDTVWANNKFINALATLIHSGDEERISGTLTEALCDVPYLALATKRQLVETFEKTLQLESAESVNLKDKDIKSYASVIFEMKKPVKKLLIKTINEKYGINVQNLKEVASFRGLVETQIVIFESLAKLAPRASVIKNVLGKVSTMLKEKEGVEAIDVNDILQAIFDKAKYTSLCENYSVSDKLTLKEMFDYELTPKEIISLIELEMNSVSDKISNLQEDSEKGYPEKGIKGGTKEAKEEESNVKSKLKKKIKSSSKEEPTDKPETPDEVQARLSGTQYGESTEEEEPQQKEPEDKPKISKEDFFDQLDNLTKILRSNPDTPDEDN